ncbi:hypothetical protein [Yinghuangia seranimata]|uniref:hypothetical protein n=1 Tax=Yinghuangia seranimata TaxID=408067 RepID=UPI00248B1933|nr:hypothetical protein [Yinghuangia seranimata]MDI2128957.1 hypothetical protein [Yinghuangia seranimata]
MSELPGGPAPTADALFDAALAEEAAKKSGLLWVTPQGAAAVPRPVWHVWHDGAVHILVATAAGGLEQYVPGLVEASRAEVTVRSKDKGGRLVVWAAAVVVLAADAPGWPDAAAALHGERLNAHDGEHAPERWARDCVIVRLGPPEAITHGPNLPDGGHAATPPPTPATTRGPLPRNFSLGRRLRGR